MRRSPAIARLKRHKAELKQLGVEHLYLFGSTARGEARHDSDVDLFFDHERGKLGLSRLMEVKELTASILGCKAEITTRASLHPVLRERIEAWALRVCWSGVFCSAACRYRRSHRAHQHRNGRCPLDVFEAGWRKRWLVERGLEIISEASRHLSDELKARHPEIPCSKVAGIGE
jgi:uncharacterized protein